MAARPVTIRDVAAALGVNPSTVSRALNPATQGMITPEVVDRVNKKATEMGYFPNRVAAALVQKRSYTVGVLIPDLMNPVFPPMIRGLQDRLEAEGYTVIVANSDAQKDSEELAYRRFRERAVDGLIMATATDDDDLVKTCLAHHQPLVLMNRTIDKPGISSVVNDDATGIRMAVDHLVSLGHSRIGHIAGPQNTSTGRTRLVEFRAHLDTLGMKEGPVQEARAFTIEEGRRGAEAMLAADAPPTAIICANDLVALGCIDALKTAELSCPGDVSVMGFDDIPFMDRMTPAMTTIGIPQYDIGASAAGLLLQQLDDDKPKPGITRLEPTLVVRDSTAVLASA